MHRTQSLKAAPRRRNNNPPEFATLRLFRLRHQQKWQEQLPAAKHGTGSQRGLTGSARHMPNVAKPAVVGDDTTCRSDRSSAGAARHADGSLATDGSAAGRPDSGVPRSSGNTIGTTLEDLRDRSSPWLSKARAVAKH